MAMTTYYPIVVLDILHPAQITFHNKFETNYPFLPQLTMKTRYAQTQVAKLVLLIS
jgi:hypothetical protein